MLPNKTQEFDYIANYLGYGDVKNGLWFIGVEPGGGWEDNDEMRKTFKELYSNSVSTYKTKDDRNIKLEDIHKWPVANATAKIATMVSRRNLDWRTYRDECLWLDGSTVFNGNILPISKYSIGSWSDGYANLLGITQQEYRESFDQIANARCDLFVDLVKLYKPQAIVCFGKSHWKTYRNFFITEEHQLPTKDIKSTLVFQTEKVILTRHFSTGMSDKILTDIASQLRQWGVELP